MVEADVFADGHDHVDASLWVCPPGGEWAETADGTAGQRPLAGRLHPRCPRALAGPRRRVGRPVRHLAGGHPGEAGRRLGHRPRAAPGRRAPRRRRRGSRALVDRPRPRAHRPPAARPLARHHVADLSRAGRARAGPLQRLVRAVPPLHRRRHRRPRHPGRRDRPPALRGRSRLRRPVPPADPPDRPSYRKGPNNTLDAGPDDVGSPWAIGATEGGHTAVHPELGTVDDVRRLAAAAGGHGLALALDIAFQCAPDHPWVREHPAWFKHRPDGSIQYAENPPKKYQDIYPFDFESADWRRPVGGAGRRDPLLDRRRRHASSASTTRTPSPSRSGSG